MNPLNRITRRMAVLAEQIARRPSSLSLEAFAAGDHLPDGTVKKAPPAIKPPLGVMPRHLWLEARMFDVQRALDEHEAAGLDMPESLVHEKIELEHMLEMAGRLDPAKNQPLRVAEAMRVIGVALFTDQGYALAWHANLAMAAFDALIPFFRIEAFQRDKIADLILERLFGLPPLAAARSTGVLDAGADVPGWRAGAQPLENPDRWTDDEIAAVLLEPAVPATFNMIWHPLFGQVGVAQGMTFTKASQAMSPNLWRVTIPVLNSVTDPEALRNALNWVTGVEDPKPVLRLRSRYNEEVYPGGVTCWRYVEVDLRQQLMPRCHVDGAVVALVSDEASAVEGAPIALRGFGEVDLNRPRRRVLAEEQSRIKLDARDARFDSVVAFAEMALNPVQGIVVAGNADVAAQSPQLHRAPGEAADPGQTK